MMASVLVLMISLRARPRTGPCLPVPTGGCDKVGASRAPLLRRPARTFLLAACLGWAAAAAGATGTGTGATEPAPPAAEAQSGADEANAKTDGLERITREGVTIEFSVRPGDGGTGRVVAADWADLSFRITDAATGEPIDVDSEQDLAALTRAHVVRVLAQEKGNKLRSAKSLGVSRRSLYRLIEKFRIQPNEIS